MQDCTMTSKYDTMQDCTMTSKYAMFDATDEIAGATDEIAGATIAGATIAGATDEIAGATIAGATDEIAGATDEIAGATDEITGATDEIAGATIAGARIAGAIDEIAGARIAGAKRNHTERDIHVSDRLAFELVQDIINKERTIFKEAEYCIQKKSIAKQMNAYEHTVNETQWIKQITDAKVQQLLKTSTSNEFQGIINKLSFNADVAITNLWSVLEDIIGTLAYQSESMIAEEKKRYNLHVMLMQQMYEDIVKDIQKASIANIHIPKTPSKIMRIR